MGTDRRAQQIESLARANEVRHWLANQKREVKTGAGGVALWVELCLSRDERLKSVAVLEFLTWLPGVGESRARRVINHAFKWGTPQSEARTISTLDAATAMRICQAVVPESAQVAA